MANEMVERVARAIVSNNHENNPFVAQWDEQPWHGKVLAMSAARAAIAAMREPTAEMYNVPQWECIEVGDDVVSPDEAVEIWQAMIDEALRDDMIAEYGDDTD